MGGDTSSLLSFLAPACSVCKSRSCRVSLLRDQTLQLDGQMPCSMASGPVDIGRARPTTFGFHLQSLGLH